MKKFFLLLLLPLFLFGGLKDSLLHYLSFDFSYNDTVGTTIGTPESGINRDSVGISNNCIQITPSKELNFDSNLSLDFGKTVSLWVKKKTSTNGIVWMDASVSSFYHGFIANLSGGGNLNLQFGDGDGGDPENRKNFTKNLSIQDTDWHHIVVVLHNIDTVYYCFDGTYGIMDYTSGTATTVDWTQNFRLGSDNTLTTYEGFEDEIAIFNFEVDSATIVDTLWNDGTGWFLFADTSATSFIIKPNGFDLNNYIKINGILIEDIYKLNGLKITE